MTKPKVALITGVTGQDGAYLSELLLAKGYEVHGIKRRSSLFNTDRIDHLYQDPHVDHQRFKLHYGDLTDSTNLIRIIQQVQPDEIYNLAAMSHVAVTFETPEYTANADGMYACNGVLFNHESPLRGETFVTRKITRAIARIALGLQDCLYLGNMSSLRDWGHAKDYVEMQWLMLQQDQPEDFVIATGVQYSVRQFVEFAARELGVTVSFSGEGDSEIGTVSLVEGDLASCKVGDIIVKVDPRYYRPTEVETLLGDPSKAKRKLGWSPTTTLAQLVAEMVNADYTAARRDSLVKEAGFQAYDHHE